MSSLIYLDLNSELVASIKSRWLLTSRSSFGVKYRDIPMNLFSYMDGIFFCIHFKNDLFVAFDLEGHLIFEVQGDHSSTQCVPIKIENKENMLWILQEDAVLMVVNVQWYLMNICAVSRLHQPCHVMIPSDSFAPSTAE